MVFVVHAVLLTTLALTSVSWAADKEKVLYAFNGGNDGEGPAGYPILDASGNLYGATVSGGPYGLGTVFELARSGKGWKESVLHSFGSGNDGANPYGLTIDGSGNMYGTTSIGGGAQKLCSEGCGTVNCGEGHGCGVVYEVTPYSGVAFELSPPSDGGGWTETILRRFTGDNSGPNSGLTWGESGFLYGATWGGGKYDDGTVFELQP